MTGPDVLVVVYWDEDEWGRTGGGPQPAGFIWPAGVPLPLVGDELAAPRGGSPLGRGKVHVFGRRWEWDTGQDGRPVVTLRLDCEWAS